MGLQKTILQNWMRNIDMQKIVEMLVKFGRSDINSLDFRGNTVLDVAVKSKMRISPETVDTLVKFGAMFCEFMKRDSENTLQPLDTLEKALHRTVSVALSKHSVISRSNFFQLTTLLNTSLSKESFEVMAVK